MTDGIAGAEDNGEDLSAFLYENRADIIRLWIRRVREALPEHSLATGVLINHLPGIIEQIADSINAAQSGDSATVQSQPQIHAVERLSRGFNLDELIGEYMILRECILELWEQRASAQLRVADVRALERAFGQSITISATRFADERQRTLCALDDISQAALSTSDQQALIEKLLQVILESMEAVDTAAVLLRDGDVLRLRAVAGVEDREAELLALNIGEGLAGKVAAEGRPAFVSDASQSALVKGSIVRTAQIHALYAVPLMAEREVIGVAQMGSRTAFEFSDDDKRLFDSMANRTSLVIQGARLQQQLEQRSAVNQAILDVALDCVISMDLGGRIVGWNKAAERTFGYRRDEAIGMDMADLIIPAHLRTAHRSAVAHHLATGEQRYFDRRIVMEAVRRDGTQFPVELTITRVEGAEPLFTGFVRDVTEEKRAEGERRRLADELARAEQAQRFLSESSKRLSESLDYDQSIAAVARLAVPAMADWCAVDLVESGQIRRVSVAHVDEDKEQFVQEAARRYPPRPDQPYGAARVIHTGCSERVREIDDSLLVESAHDPEHLRILRQLGLKSCIAVPVAVRGTVFGAITFVSAESGRRYTEEDLRTAEEFALRVATAIENARLYGDARMAIRTREDVLAVVSHDLRNQLGIVSINAEVLATALPSSTTVGADRTLSPEAIDRQRKHVEVIRRATNHMNHLIGDLLDMASIQARSFPVDLRPTKLVALLGEAFEAYEPVAREAGITLRNRAELPEIEIRCDQDRLIQALSNLLGNAVKFCERGDQVTLGAELGEEHVLVSVADTGPGIAADHVQDIFDAYKTVSRDGKPGTGLGLYITKATVEAHGGRIWVDSQPGHGSTFFFTIPLRQ
jgi:PAS domain S-box-containing protein